MKPLYTLPEWAFLILGSIFATLMLGGLLVCLFRVMHYISKEGNEGRAPGNFNPQEVLQPISRLETQTSTQDFQGEGAINQINR